MRDHWKYFLLLLGLILLCTSISAQSDIADSVGVKSDSVRVAYTDIPIPNRTPDEGGGGFGDDDQDNPTTDGDSEGTFGDGDQSNPSTDGNSGGFGDSDMGGSIPLGDIIKGDVNGDGSVTITDAVAVVNYILGNPSDNFNIVNANVNGDVDELGNPNISITDAVGIVNIILNSSSSSGAPEMAAPTVEQESGDWSPEPE